MASSVFLNPGGTSSSGGTTTATTFLAGDGTAAAPSYSFASNPDTGGYISGSNLRWSIDGTLEMQLAAGALVLTATSPSITLGSDVSLSRGAANRLDLADNDSFKMGGTGQLLAADGTAAAPAYSFAATGEQDLGMYRISTDSIGLAFAGVLRHHFTGNYWGLLHDSAVIELGAASDIRLSRGAANRLDLATGDSLYLVSGGLGVGVTPPAAGMIGLTEQTAPSAPAANAVTLYAVDNGGGKTQLMALFASGAAQQLAIQP